MRKDPWIFGWIFFESLRRQRTKFTHFALVTFAQYCTRHFGLSKPFDPILKSWNLCDKSQSLLLVFLCVLESKISLNSQSFSDRGLDISIFLGFYFFFSFCQGQTSDLYLFISLISDITRHCSKSLFIAYMNGVFGSLYHHVVWW